MNSVNPFLQLSILFLSAFNIKLLFYWMFFDPRNDLETIFRVKKSHLSILYSKFLFRVNRSVCRFIVLIDFQSYSRQGALGFEIIKSKQDTKFAAQRLKMTKLSFMKCRVC